MFYENTVRCLRQVCRSYKCCGSQKLRLAKKPQKESHIVAKKIPHPGLWQSDFNF